MTEDIKRMLAERAMLASPPPPKPHDPMLETLTNAKPFLDEGWNGKGWRPSEVLTVGYCAMHWSDPGAAASWIAAHLEIARQRYRDGFRANPFGEAFPA